MNYYIKNNPNELYHYGVKGMKWGVRRYQKKSGKLTAEGYQKYYTNGRINYAGTRARAKARDTRSLGRRNLVKSIGGATAGALVFHYALGGKYVNKAIHQAGNLTITKMRMSGASVGKRRAVAAAFIGAMGLYTAAEVSGIAKAAYVGGRYNFDRSYKNRTDARANLKTYEKQQREFEKSK